MDFKKQLKEIEAQKEVLNFINLFGVGDNVKNIISPECKKPVVTFKPKTQEEYKKIIDLLKPNIYNNIYKESNGTTGFKPITASPTP